MKLKKLLVAVIATSLVMAFILPTRAADNTAATVMEENTPAMITEEETPTVVMEEAPAVVDNNEDTETTEATDDLSETPKEATETILSETPKDTTETVLPESKETEATEEVSAPAAAPVLRNQPVREAADENVIPDETLKKHINFYLNINVQDKRPEDAPISKEDILKLRDLVIVNAPVKSLAGLEHATNLESLSLMRIEAADISNIAELPRLKQLSLLDLPSVKDWRPISKMKQLNVLRIGMTYDYFDAGIVSNLTNLKSLQLHDNIMPDITPIANLTQLESLNLSGNRISDITPLKDLHNLEYLLLYNNCIADFSSLPSGIQSLIVFNQTVHVRAQDGKVQNPFVNPDGTKDFSVESTTNVTVSGNEFTLTDPSQPGIVSLKSNMPKLEFPAKLIIDPDGSHTVTLKFGQASRYFAAPGTKVSIDCSKGVATLPHGKTFKFWKVISGNVAIENSTQEQASFIMPDEDVEIGVEFDQTMAESFTLTSPEEKLLVQNTTKLTKEEQDAVIKSIQDNNPSLPVGTEIKVEDAAEYTKFTIVFPDGSEQVVNNTDFVGKHLEVRITDGDGSGFYKPATTIDITANAAPEGKTFDQWVLVSGNATIADVNAPATKVTLGTEDATIQATYKDITYHLSVQAGQGTGDYVQDAVVDITANEPGKGKVFDQWVLVSGNATIADINAPSTKVTLGTEDATIQATYKDITYKLTIEAGQGSGDYAQDAVVDITADEAPEGKVFDQWVLVNGDATIDDVNAAATKVTMGTQDATIQATYKDAPKQPVDDPNDDNKPGDNKPGDNKPGDNKPGDNKPGKTPTGATGVKRPMPSTGIPGETLTLLTMISLLGGAYAGRKFGHGKK